MEITITTEQKIPVSLNPVTLSGKPAKLDGTPTWTGTSGLGTVVPSADGLSCDLVSSDSAGDTVILVEADADLGPGVQTISDTITLHCVSPQAANLGLTVGVAVPK